MAEKTTTLWSLLSWSLPYSLLQRAVGADRIYRLFLQRAAIRPDDRVLDIGCGTAEILRYLPPVDYVGVDPSAAYIEAARRKHSGKGTFIRQRAADLSSDSLGKFDRALVMSVLHHLDDDEVGHLMRTARASLRNDGRLVTLDPCYTDRQGRLTRWILGLDRGRNIRTESGYLRLAREAFPRVESFSHENVLRIPYSHLIMRCTSR